MRVLVVNAGSTSLKLRVVEADDRPGPAENLHPDDDAGMDRFVDRVGSLAAVGHRVVHGGPHFVEPLRLDGPVRASLEQLSDLAPLHNPPALRAADDLAARLPEVPAVACFDTAFHASLPAEAYRYALPADWTRRWGLRRYGFHGLSCTWALQRAAQMLGRDRSELRLAVCHLGGGASVTAVAGGRSVDTTMGFTPAEGLVMATRVGDVDPGALAWLASRGVGGEEMTEALERHSGLLALSGTSGDMRELLARRGNGDRAAAGAVDVFVHRLAAKVAAMAAATGGLDALVFTGGIGEHSSAIRAETVARLAWMGCGLDPAANQAAGSGDSDISAPGSPVTTLVIEAREELVVAAACRALLG